MKKIVLSLTAILSASFLFSQEALKSTEEEYYDFLSLQGIVERPTLGYRTLSDSEWKFIEKEVDVVDEDGNPLTDEAGNKLTNLVMPDHPWQKNNLGTKRTLWQGQEGKNWFTRGFDHSLKLKIYGPEWYNSFNTAAPYGQNDGALWQGKGYNSSLTGGARLEAYGFEVTLKPQVSFSQNLSFDMLPGAYASEYSYFYAEGGGVDLVQRYGDSAFWNYDWGDSELRWSWKTFTIGFGTQSPWIGPAMLNPMLGSNNAASYPKFDLGVRRTKTYLPFGKHRYIGDVEGRIWGGYLSESKFFDNDSSNDHNLITGLSLSYSPSFLKGFTISVNRIFLTKWTLSNLKYLARLFTTNDSNEAEDGKITLNIDWQFPSVGFEVFGEIGKDDYSRFPENPLHTVIYTVGAKQYIPIYGNTVKGELLFEWNNFEMSQDFQTQWQYKGWFSHGMITQGYTNKGQTLAGGYGSFGNSQFLGFKIYYPLGSTELFVHRFRPDDNYVSNQAVYSSANENYYWHDSWKCYFSVGLDSSYFITKSLLATGGIVFMHIYNPLYTQSAPNMNNFFFLLDMKYNF